MKLNNIKIRGSAESGIFQNREALHDTREDQNSQAIPKLLVVVSRLDQFFAWALIFYDEVHWEHKKRTHLEHGA